MSFTAISRDLFIRTKNTDWGQVIAINECDENRGVCWALVVTPESTLAWQKIDFSAPTYAVCPQVSDTDFALMCDWLDEKRIHNADH